jgi:hypothetical protein
VTAAPGPSDAISGARGQLRFYVIWQAALVVASASLPSDGWLRALLQTAVGWTAAAFVFAAGRRIRREAAIWYLFGAGLFFNSTGILVERILVEINAGPIGLPSLADLFWLALYPCFVLALVLMYRRREGDESRGFGPSVSTAASTVVATALTILAWELILLPQAASAPPGAMARFVATLYPTGDLVVLTLLLRLMLEGRLYHWASLLTMASVLCFLVGNVGWAFVFYGDGHAGEIGNRVLPVIFLCAFALLGAAACCARPGPNTSALRTETRTTTVVAASLAVSLLTAPLVLLAQVLLE